MVLPDPGVMAAVFLGFLSGCAVAAIGGRWLALFLRALFDLLGLRRQSSLSRPRAGGISLLLLAHPAPWILFALLPYLAYRTLWAQPAPLARYFFAALIASLLLIVGSVLWVFRRAWRLRAQRKANQTGN